MALIKRSFRLAFAMFVLGHFFALIVGQLTQARAAHGADLKAENLSEISDSLSNAFAGNLWTMERVQWWQKGQLLASSL